MLTLAFPSLGFASHACAWATLPSWQHFRGLSAYRDLCRVLSVGASKMSTVAISRALHCPYAADLQAVTTLYKEQLPSQRSMPHSYSSRALMLSWNGAV